MRKTITTLILLAAITTAAAQTTIFGIEFRNYKNPDELISTYRNNAREFNVEEVPLPVWKVKAHYVTATSYRTGEVMFDALKFGLMPEDEPGKGQELGTLEGISLFTNIQDFKIFLVELDKMVKKENLQIENVENKEGEDIKEGDPFLKITYKPVCGLKTRILATLMKVEGYLMIVGQVVVD